MRTRAIVSLAVREKYVPYMARLERSVERHGFNGDLVKWVDIYPPGSPTHQDMHYAFKVYAVLDAFERGYETVLWLDTSSYLTNPPEPLFDLIEAKGYYLSHGTDPLGYWISDKALSEFGYSRDQAMEMKLLAGCIFGLSKKSPVAMEFLREWHRLAKTGLFTAVHNCVNPGVMRSIEHYTEGQWVSTDPRCKGHRSDEAVLTLVAHRLGMEAFHVGTHYFDGGCGTHPDGIVSCNYDPL